MAQGAKATPLNLFPALARLLQSLGRRGSILPSENSLCGIARRSMSNTLRPAGIGVLILFGLLAGHDVARAQFGNNNPYLGNQQYLYNLQFGRAALANSMVNPSPAYAMPYPTPAYNPYM